jgi:hypothetical protein
MFKANQNKGFQMTFANGYTVSVQFGAGNYCENRYQKEDSMNFQTSSMDAELMVFKPDGEPHTFPVGWMSTNEVANILERIANL